MRSWSSRASRTRPGTSGWRRLRRASPNGAPPARPGCAAATSSGLSVATAGRDRSPRRLRRGSRRGGRSPPRSRGSAVVLRRASPSGRTPSRCDPCPARPARWRSCRPRRCPPRGCAAAPVRSIVVGVSGHGRRPAPRRVAAASAMPVPPSRLAHGLQSVRVREERIELLGQAGAVALVVGDNDGSAQAGEGLGVAGLVVSRRARQRDQNRGHGGDEELGDRHGPGPGDADVGRGVQVGHALFEGNDPVAERAVAPPLRRTRTVPRRTPRSPGARSPGTRCGPPLRPVLGQFGDGPVDAQRARATRPWRLPSRGRRAGRGLCAPAPVPASSGPTTGQLGPHRRPGDLSPG